MSGATANDASRPWCYTAPANPPVQIRMDPAGTATEAMCLSYDWSLPRVPAAAAAAAAMLPSRPLRWTPCGNASVERLTGAQLDDALASQLWSVDAARGTAALWSAAGSGNGTDPRPLPPILVVNERNFGSQLRHEVPLRVPTLRGGGPANVSAGSVLRMRVRGSASSVIWGEAGCHGRGVCDVADGGRCHCFAGYVGSECAVELNECASRPCQHGGVCVDLPSWYTCTCQAGYTGHDCEHSVLAPSSAAHTQAGGIRSSSSSGSGSASGSWFGHQDA
jgi:hypothetical protein|eukprot:COSAG01_NODE_164_length_23340_cov_76.030033_2_plen_278_part_00